MERLFTVGGVQSFVGGVGEGGGGVGGGAGGGGSLRTETVSGTVEMSLTFIFSYPSFILIPAASLLFPSCS